MDVELYDFDLPEELIAQTPLLERSASRLLTLNKQTGATEHHTFNELLSYLKPGDTLVLNDTRVIPARMFGVKKDTGAKAELDFSLEKAECASRARTPVIIFR